VILGLITRHGKWPYLWREWLTSVDHKRIGVMYLVLAGVMLLRGFADALLMRSQQALAGGASAGYLPPGHFDQIFGAHGTIMIFFMAMPFLVGLWNLVVPLQRPLPVDRVPRHPPAEKHGGRLPHRNHLLSARLRRGLAHLVVGHRRRPGAAGDCRRPLLQ
jgi:hypothetical protein